MIGAGDWPVPVLGGNAGLPLFEGELGEPDGAPEGAGDGCPIYRGIVIGPEGRLPQLTAESKSAALRT